MLQEASRFLSGAGCPCPEVDAERLLSHLLGLSRLQLYLDGPSHLLAHDTRAYRRLLRKRASRIPLQYILGETEFMSLPFLVAPAVLIPRPETEVLVQCAIDYLRTAGSERPMVADVGTGSGIIAVTVAHLAPRSVVFATDLSAGALRIAAANTRRITSGETVTFMEGDLVSPLKRAGLDGQLDCLLSNPPYIPAAELLCLPPEIVGHEPLSALDGGADGLVYHRRLVSEGAPLLRAGGLIALEVGGYEQAESVTEMLQRSTLFGEVRVIRDLNDIPRVVAALRR